MDLNCITLVLLAYGLAGQVTVTQAQCDGCGLNSGVSCTGIAEYQECYVDGSLGPLQVCAPGSVCTDDVNICVQGALAACGDCGICNVGMYFACTGRQHYELCDNQSMPNGTWGLCPSGTFCNSNDPKICTDSMEALPTCLLYEPPWTEGPGITGTIIPPTTIVPEEMTTIDLTTEAPVATTVPVEMTTIDLTTEAPVATTVPEEITTIDLTTGAPVATTVPVEMTTVEVETTTMLEEITTSEPGSQSTDYTTSLPPIITTANYTVGMPPIITTKSPMK